MNAFHHANFLENEFWLHRWALISWQPLATVCFQLQNYIDFSQTSKCCERMRNVWIPWRVFTDWKVLFLLTQISQRGAFSRNFCQQNLSSLEVTSNLLEGGKLSHAALVRATVRSDIRLVSIPKIFLCGNCFNRGRLKFPEAFVLRGRHDSSARKYTRRQTNNNKFAQINFPCLMAHAQNVLRHSGNKSSERNIVNAGDSENFVGYMVFSLILH